MSRIVALVLVAIVVAGLATWRHGAGPTGRSDSIRASAGPVLDAAAARSAPPASTASPSVPSAAVAAALPARGTPGSDRLDALAGDPAVDPATGISADAQTPTDVLATSPGRVVPPNSEVDPATGVIVLRGAPDDLNIAVSTTGPAPPAGVEIDPATGAPGLR